MGPEEAAWLAGLIEGEGCLDFNRIKHRWVRIRIVMKDHDVLVRVQALAGGIVRVDKRKAEPGWSQYYVWSLHRKNEVKAILETIMPWLGERRKSRALELLAVCG